MASGFRPNRRNLCANMPDRLTEEPVVLIVEPAQSGWRPTLSFVFGSRVAQPGWQSCVELLDRILAAIDGKDVAASLGMALSAVDALEILLGQGLKLQEPLLARFRQISLAAIEQEVELKSRAELARMLARVGDPRVIDDLNDPTAWVEVPAGTYRVGDEDIKALVAQSQKRSAVFDVITNPTNVHVTIA